MTRPVRELEVVLRTVDGVLVASASGEIDLDTRDRFERALEPLRQADGPAVIDLERVPFMDSSGLHVVVQLCRALQRDGRALTVACGGAGVRKLFELTALDSLVPLYDGVAAAVRGASGGEPPVSARAF